MSEQIAVSVIMLTYNHEKYVKKAILSVLQQKFDQGYEVIIGDDCSTDKTASIIKRIADSDDRIIPILREKNIGATKNSIDLESRCRGKYICFLEGDDFWVDNEKLKKQYSWLESHSEYFAVAARYDTCDEDSKVIIKNKISDPQLVTKDNYGKVGMPHIGTLMFRNVDNADNAWTCKYKWAELYALHSIITDWSVYLYIIDQSDLYIMSDVVHCWRYVSKKGASNYNSLIKYKLNRYDVINERMQYEQKLNAFPFKRIKTNYKAYNWAKQLCAYLLLDFKKESRKYGKNILKTKFYPLMSKKERIKLPFGTLLFYCKAIKIKIEYKLKK